MFFPTEVTHVYTIWCNRVIILFSITGILEFIIVCVLFLLPLPYMPPWLPNKFRRLPHDKYTIIRICEYLNEDLMYLLEFDYYWNIEFYTLALVCSSIIIPLIITPGMFMFGLLYDTLNILLLNRNIHFYTNTAKYYYELLIKYREFGTTKHLTGYKAYYASCYPT